MSLSEFQLIQRHFASIGLGDNHEGIALGIGDDAAILNLPATLDQCISTDVLVESVHFPASADGYLVGQRALLVNLSDLAAMGARPLCFTLGISLPHADYKWVDRFSKGLLHVARKFHCPLVGGDTTRGPLTISVQVHGVVAHGQALRRDTAKAGDVVLVTGSLGKGAIALAALGEQVHFDPALHEQLKTTGEEAIDATEPWQTYFYCPQPRLAFAQQAAPLINSAIDISDGLAGDLLHILQRSNVGAKIELENIPFAPEIDAITSVEQRQSAALFGGDDYELCFTAAKDKLPALAQIARELALPLAVIGEIEVEPGLRFFAARGARIDIDAMAYDHFRSGGGS